LRIERQHGTGDIGDQLDIQLRVKAHANTANAIEPFADAQAASIHRKPKRPPSPSHNFFLPPVGLREIRMGDGNAVQSSFLKSPPAK
jgi:hypothetical protein